MGRRCQVGAVSFYKEMVQGDVPGRFFETAALRENQGTGEGDVESQFHHFFRRFQAAGEAVHNASHAAASVLFQYGKGVAVGFPVMDQEGKVQVFGQFYLTAKPFFLGFLIAVEEVVVQADFADGFDFRR